MYAKKLNWRNVVAIAISSAVLMAFNACDETNNGLEGEGKTVEVTKVTINPPASVDLDAGGKSITLTVTIEPANATDKTVTWSSSNTSIATVSATGVVTGVGEGTVTITATSKNGNKEAEYTLTVKPDPAKQPVELKSPIRENTTLKDLGLPVDYFFAGNGLLSVENNAVLTIEPGVTIQFTHSYLSGGIEIKAGSTINAIGTASKHIRFIGANNAKGSWQMVLITSNTDNQFAYCDFENIGYNPRVDYSGIQIYNGRAGLSHCKLSGGLGTGLSISGNSQISTFDNNVFEDFDLPPVYTDQDKSLKVLEKFDMTSDFTKNKYPYISINKPYLNEDVTLNETTVPYYFGTGSGNKTLDLTHVLTINAGVTIYMGDGQAISGSAGRLMVKGTANKKVTFTRYPGGANYYWNEIYFSNGLKGSELEYCILEYGGSPGTGNGILGINQFTDVTLKNVEINNSQTYGVFIGNCDYKLTHSNVSFSNCASGNVYDGCARPQVVRNHFP